MKFKPYKFTICLILAPITLFVEFWEWRHFKISDNLILDKLRKYKEWLRTWYEI